MHTVLSSVLSVAAENKHDTLWVAFSGGLDSTVLLHALTQVHPVEQIKAIHVNHQLSPNSDDWALSCQHFCEHLGVACFVHKVSVEGQGNIESKARQLRYDVFVKHLPKKACLLMAHHRDDQIETFFLKAFSGHGAGALSGMPYVREIIDKQLVRPFLSINRKALENYAQHNALSWVEDESNAQVGFDRNWIRHELIPLIETRFTGVRASISKSQQKLALAQKCLQDLADKDIPLAQPAIPLADLLSLPVYRQKNFMNQWCYHLSAQQPSLDQVTEFLRQCTGEDNHAQLLVGNVLLRRWRDHIYAYPQDLPEPPQAHQWRAGMPLPTLGGAVSIDASALGLDDTFYQVYYWGQELPADLSPSKHHLKNRFQSLAIPPWHRPYIPLITKEKKLVVPICKIVSYSPSC